MPTYVYKFLDSGETIEVQQAFTDDSLTEYVHPESGAVLPVKKVFQPVGVTFKGSGFFKTDNRGAPSTSKDSKDSRDSKDSKDSTDSKTSKDSKDSTPASPKKESTTGSPSTTKDTKAATTPVAAAGRSD